jgi:hypothetical protein
MKEYVATFKTSYQISQDEWDVCNPSLKINEQTTIKEVNEFFSKNNGGQLMEVRISELQSL